MDAAERKRARKMEDAIDTSGEPLVTLEKRRRVDGLHLAFAIDMEVVKAPEGSL